MIHALMIALVVGVAALHWFRPRKIRKAPVAGFPCPVCPGRVVPLATPGRISTYNGVAGLAIPADLELPTCNRCGEEWLDHETTMALDDALREARYAAIHQEDADAAYFGEEP